MTDPRFDRAVVSADGLEVEWSGVPLDDAQETLLLSVVVLRQDGTEVRFCARWIRGDDVPGVFAFDSRAVEQREHEAPETATVRSGDDVRVVFPRNWVEPLIDSGDLEGIAVVSVDGTDRAPAELRIEVAV